jgi:hypothetical protein
MGGGPSCVATRCRGVWRVCGEGGSVWVGLVIDTVYPRAAVFLRKRRGLALAVMLAPWVAAYGVTADG